MFDISSSELLLTVIVAVVVIGPKDLPRVLYKLGQITGKARAMTRHFRAGIDEMVRQAELEELEKKWAADNARIMAQTDPTAAMITLPEPAAAAHTGDDVTQAPLMSDTAHGAPASVEGAAKEHSGPAA